MLLFADIIYKKGKYAVKGFTANNNNADIMEDDGMGMMTGLGISNSNTRRIHIKDINGTVVGTISIAKSKNKKTKRLQYNFKQISSQIMKSKTSTNARRVVTKARAKVVELLRKKYNSDFDNRELDAAIIHAKKMERIARKRMKHLKEEEAAKQQGFCTNEWEERTESYMKDAELKKHSEPSKEELMQLMQELKELMKKSMDEFTDETGLEELENEIIGIKKEDMEPEELERLKKKHRADELREIMEADMKYLRALFDKLEKEKQSISNGSGNLNSLSGITLELAGTEMPVETIPQPVVTEGGSIDFSV